jgi:tripartite-type tricarboxylate transporter receptor subunit TctC
MSVPRRHVLRLTAGAVAATALARTVHAQAWPNRPIRMLLGFAAGGSADIAARQIAQWLTDRLGQPVVIENRTGAASNIAAEAVARSAPDGYTLFFGTSANAINATFYDNLKFDLKNDFAPVAGVLRTPNVLNVNPSLPVRTVPEFIAHLRENPGRLAMASTGNGTSIHLAGELFMSMTGTKMVHVPYRSPPQAMTDLIAGQVQVMFDVITQGLGHVKAGRLRALAVTTASPVGQLPGVPPLAEFVPGYEASSWNAVLAPNGTPAEIVERLNREIIAGLNHPPIKERMASGGGTPFTESVPEFTRFVADEIEKWGKLVRALNLKAD